VLAIEAARAGETSGEATAVLQSLSSDTAEFAPARLRRPRRRVVLGGALVIGLVAGLIAYFATRTEVGPGEPATPKAGGLGTIRVASSAAHDYDPEGDGKESSEATQNAIDGNTPTDWDTETYEAGLGGVGKSGVGLYVDAGRRVTVRRIDIATSTPGWEAEIYAADEVPETIAGWTKVSRRTEVQEDQRIPIDTRAGPHRYFLVWIVTLPSDNKAKIQELRLLR
jgi:serine/threonine-protein kinase